MKSNQILLIAFATVFLASCSMVEKNNFSNRKYTNNKVAHVEIAQKQVVENKKLELSEAKNSSEIKDLKDVKFELSPIAEYAKVEVQETQTSVKTSKATLKSSIVRKVSELKTAARKNKLAAVTSQNSIKKSSSISDEELLFIILAVLIPPLAVFLKFGISNKFWIDILLTIFFYLPGIIYALIVVL